MNLLFKPIGLIAGIAAGIVAKKLFEASWQLVDGEAPPEAEVREISTPKLIVSLVLEGAIFALVKGLVDRGARNAFARYTGSWPGQEAPAE